MEEGELIIRDMRLSDVPVISTIEKELFSDPWPDVIFAEDIKSELSYPYVAQFGNEIAGYAILWVGYDEGHLTNIAVAKKYQRKSIANRILSFILSVALEKHLEQVVLEVRPSNEAAIALYEKFGFERLAIRRNYYRKPVEDCLVMRRIMVRNESGAMDI